MSSDTKDAEHQPFLDYSDKLQEVGLIQKYIQPQGNRKTLVSHSLVFLLTSLAWILVLSAISSSIQNPRSDRHNITSHARLLSCGYSTKEAQKLGCQYDVLLNSWVPEQCIDQDYVDEYKDDGSWAAFSDKNMTQRLTVEELPYTDVYYTSVRDHVNHCATMWKKQFWAMYTESSAIDSMSASPGHTDHCAQYLMDVTERNSTEPTRVEMGYAGCWIRD